LAFDEAVRRFAAAPTELGLIEKRPTGGKALRKLSVARNAADVVADHRESNRGAQ
jgi:hypothetical protein